MCNFVTFYRFSNQMEDVFLEDNHLLYACSEPFDRACMLACNEYRPIPPAGRFTMPDDTSEWEWVRYDTCGADTAYLQTLEPAPPTIAAHVILEEFAHEYGNLPYDEFAELLDVKRDNLLNDLTRIVGEAILEEVLAC